VSVTPGTRLGPYEIVSGLGAGGMGEVYRATDTKLKRQVAIKVLPPSLADDAHRLARFQSEAEALAAVNHPHIAAIYGLEDAGGVKALVMELVEGEDLARRIARGPVPIEDVLLIVKQIAEALEAAHQQGIIHRDIKPGNVIVRHDGFVKLLDFGLAKFQAAHVDVDAPTRSLTEPGTVAGTALYMSPEQARGLTVDARTDIFSLGVLLYEMITGRLPFNGSTTGELVASILSEKEPQPLARYSRDAPAELERIVSKALRKNREERYQTIQDMRLDVKSLSQELEFQRQLERSGAPQPARPAETREQPQTDAVIQSAARSTDPAGDPTSAAILRQRSRVIAIAAAALLTSAAAAGWYFYFMRGQAGVITSIAVLPFINASGNSDVAYLSDGLTDSLISSLSQLPKLSVKSRHSVFRYKGSDAPPKEVGQALHVDAMLTGRVVQRGTDVTLHIELVEVDTERALWSEDYRRSMTNLVSLPGEIARDVSSELRLKLSGADEQKLARHYTENAEAYRAYLQGRFYSSQSTEIGLKKGTEYFNQAIAIDPNYALAWAGMAYACWGDSDVHVAPRDVMPKAKQAATKAIAIDDTLAEGHAALAIALTAYDWDWPNAEKEFRRAIDLNADYPTAHAHYGWYLSLMGRTEEAITESQRAIDLDPLSTEYNHNLGLTLFRGRRYDQAVEQFRKTLNLDPNDWITRTNLGWALISQGSLTEALNELRSVRQIDDNHYVLAALGQAYALSGNRSEALKAIEQMREWSKERYVSPHSVALVYAGLGEKDLALEWLDKAVEMRSEHLGWLKVDPRVDSLRSDPRFSALMRRVGF
jgi:serine/threonine protein kinase/Tfp pilus assembly protein PilF